MSLTPQVIGTTIVTIIMIIYFAIKAFKELSEHFGWFSQKRKERMALAEAARRQEITQIVEECISRIVPPMIEGQLQHNKEQDQKLDKLIQSSNDTLRQEMIQIYHKYLPYQKILYYDRENFNKLFKDYVSQDGNSFMTTIKAEMDTWSTVMTEKEL